MFHPLDMKTWYRRELFYYFSQMAPTTYSLTVDVDVTNLLSISKKKNIKFFPAYLWLVTRNLNQFIEFKCAVKDGILGFYDTLTPLYASWHEESHSFSFMWTEFSDSFEEFYENYLRNQKQYGDNPALLAKSELPPENAYTVSAVPWIQFKHFSVHSDTKRPYFFPSVEAGKYYPNGSRFLMPISLTCHHATSDGYHVSEFLKALQQDMDHFDLLLGE